MRHVLLWSTFLCLLQTTATLAEPDKQPPSEQVSQTPEDNSATPAPSEAVESSATEDTAPAKTAVSTTKDMTVSSSASETGTLQPRVELAVPSIRHLWNELHRSQAGPLVSYARRMVALRLEDVEEGALATDFESLLGDVESWPDTSIYAAEYASDLDGRARWAIRLDWSLETITARLGKLLAHSAAEELLQGIKLRKESEGLAITLRDVPIAYMTAGASEQTVIRSHPGLVLGKGPTEALTWPEPGKAVLACRVAFKGTEADSGSTFFSSLSVVTGVNYTGFVDDTGKWQERINVEWPPISGMVAKSVLGRVKQTFFVPRNALASAVVDTPMLPTMVEQMAGFGPQFIMEDAGEMGMVGNTEPGAIATLGRSTACITLLPGTGFIPMPDIIIQSRVKKPDEMMSQLQEASQEINRLYEQREQAPPWKQFELGDGIALYKDDRTASGGAMLPVSFRPVIFTAKEKDGRGKERDLLVVALTSTTPKQIAERWLAYSRTRDFHHMPQRKKTNGQLWVNTKSMYRWLAPYVSVPVSLAAGSGVMPSLAEFPLFEDAYMSLKASYSGIALTNEGPLPIGVWAVPACVALSMDQDNATDLARERLARERLRVFFHHAELFHKDIGRWPAELRELDGYIDFAGHPELLRLPVSSQKSVQRWFEDIFDVTEPEYSDITDYETPIGEDVFTIDYRDATWHLAVVPDTFEHLESLYIDQDGVIHRSEKKADQSH